MPPPLLLKLLLRQLRHHQLGDLDGTSLPTGSGAVADANASLVAAAKKPLIQPDKADFLPQKMINGRPAIKLDYGKMSIEELIDSRAKTYNTLLNPEYANEKPGVGGAGGFHYLDRASLKHVDAELIKRGEDVSMLPDVAAYDPDYVPGSGKTAPYLRSKEPIASTTTPESMGAPFATKVKETVGETKAEEIVSEVTASVESTEAIKTAERAVKTGVDDLSAAVAASAPVPPVAPVSAVADALVASGTTAAAGAAAGAKTSAGILNVGKKIVSNPKHMAALGVAAAAGIIAFRSI
ncbi:hypothetical protein [Flavobacterium sp.]|uniref:hypothetical protein n=1 Tax=Flavobacterium sp. TaxID=239 RepID=UPI003BD764D0